MIRINLLGREAEKQTSGWRSLQMPEMSVGASQAGMAGMFILVMAGVAFSFWQQKQGLRTLQTELATVQAERARLQEVADQVNAVKDRTELLRQKLQVIVQLKANQTGPVMLLDQVSRRMTDGLWLTQLELQDQGVTLRGAALSNAAVADFVNNLEASDHFDAVRLRTLVDSGESFSFEIRFRFAPWAAATPMPLVSTPGGGGG